MTEKDIAELESKLNRGKEIVSELRQLRAAAAIGGKKTAAYKTWNTASDLLPEPLLLRVIAAGIASLIAKLEQELESLDVGGGEPQPVNVGYEHDDDYEPDDRCHYCGGDGWGIVGDDWDSDDPINGPYNGETQRCPCCNGTGLAKDCTFW